MTYWKFTTWTAITRTTGMTTSGFFTDTATMNSIEEVPMTMAKVLWSRVSNERLMHGSEWEARVAIPSSTPNKPRQHEQKQLAKGKEPRYTSHRLDRITTKRNRRVMHYLHTASRRIIELLVAEGIGTLVLGKNPFWKTRVALGKKNNQEFVQIPHATFLEMLTYKAEALGIRVIVTEESYTSKASFLDLDVLPSYDPTQGADQEEKPHFSGYRDGRWYRVKGRAPMHSAVNGSFNIGRKVFPTAFGQEIAATAVRPRRLAV